MRTSADYRELAGHCVRLAQAASTPEHRSLLLNIAHAWLRLAEGAEFDKKLALASPPSGSENERHLAHSLHHSKEFVVR
jgi:hypothetical protein